MPRAREETGIRVGAHSCWDGRAQWQSRRGGAGARAGRGQGRTTGGAPFSSSVSELSSLLRQASRAALDRPQHNFCAAISTKRPATPSPLPPPQRPRRRARAQRSLAQLARTPHTQLSHNHTRARLVACRTPALPLLPWMLTTAKDSLPRAPGDTPAAVVPQHRERTARAARRHDDRPLQPHSGTRRTGAHGQAHAPN